MIAILVDRKGFAKSFNRFKYTPEINIPLNCDTNYCILDDYKPNQVQITICRFYFDRWLDGFENEVGIWIEK